MIEVYWRCPKKKIYWINPRNNICWRGSGWVKNICYLCPYQEKYLPFYFDKPRKISRLSNVVSLQLYIIQCMPFS